MESAVGTVEQKTPMTNAQNLKHLAGKILETMAGLERNYGPSYIVSVVVGKIDGSWRDEAHTQLKTFASIPPRFRWRVTCAIHYLADLGLLQPKGKGCATIGITDAGRGWLETREDIPVQPMQLRFTGLEWYLRDMLRQHRREVAQAEVTDPWQVFTDYSLDRLVMGKPLGFEELLRVPGFDHAKCERYGVGILRCVQDVLENYEDYRMANLRKRANGRSFQKIKKCFEEGFTLHEIRVAMGFTLETVVRYLCDLHEVGDVDLVPWIERNVNSQTLFSAVEYLKRVSNPTLMEGARALGVDINLMRFAVVYHKDQEAGAKPESMAA